MTRHGIAIGAIIASLLLAPALWGQARGAVVALDRLRQITATLAVEAAAPPIGPTALIAGGRPLADDAAGARRALADRLRIAAGRSGVLLEQIAPGGSAAPIISVAIVASGSEAALIDFARAIEGRDPLVRFSRWRITSGEDAGSLRLEASAVALWGRA
jgi:hypothetical protein